MTKAQQPSSSLTRRQVLCAAAGAAAVAAATPLVGTFAGVASAAADAGRGEGPNLIGPATAPTTRPDPWHGLKVGVASYSFRKLPLDVTIKDIQRLALHYVSIKDVHLKLDSTPEKRHEVATQFKDAGITPLSCGVVSMGNDEAKCRQAFEYARDLGVPTIVCSPAPDALSLLDKLVKEFDVRLAIHNHGPEDKKFPSPNEVWQAVQGHDERIGLCIDVGHTARAGVDPAEAIVKYKSRLYDIHFKDVTRTDRRGTADETEVGRGVLDIRGMLKAMLEINYAHHVGFEHERNPEDPLPGLSESVGYTKAALACVVSPPRGG